MKKRLFKLFVAAALLAFSVSSCEVLNQLIGVANLANCKYDLKNVSNVYVAGVSISNISNGNITAGDVLKLSSALLAKKVPITMNVNVNVNNPTAQSAQLTAMDWIAEIDGTQFATGTSTQAYTITPNSTTTVALPVSADIYTIFSKNGLESLKNFVTSFGKDGNSSKIGIKIKPSVNIGGVNFPSPQFIDISKTTGSSNTNNNTTDNTSNGGTQHTSGNSHTPTTGGKTF